LSLQRHYPQKTFCITAEGFFYAANTVS